MKKVTSLIMFVFLIFTIFSPVLVDAHHKEGHTQGPKIKLTKEEKKDNKGNKNNNRFEEEDDDNEDNDYEEGRSSRNSSNDSYEDNEDNDDSDDDNKDKYVDQRERLKGKLRNALGNRFRVLDSRPIELQIAVYERILDRIEKLMNNPGKAKYTTLLEVLEEIVLEKLADLGGDENQAPLANDDIANTTKNQGVEIDVSENDSDPDGSIDETSVEIKDSPLNGDVKVDETTGIVTYSPDTDFMGVDSFSYTVKDNEGKKSNEATVTISVVAGEEAPTANNDEAETEKNTSVNIDVTENDTDTDGTIDPTTVNITSEPLNGSLEVDEITGVITYTPNTDFLGNDSFAYTVGDNNGNTSNIATVNITVVTGPESPVANDDSAMTEENTSVEIDVTANDTDSDGTIDLTTVNITSGPNNGSGSVDPTSGVVTYTPNQDFNGNDSFSYTVNDNDGNTSNEATVMISVNTISENPIANDDNTQTDEDTSVEIDVTANDTDSDGTIDPTTVNITSGPNNGSGSVDPTSGVVTYTPNQDFNGNDSFSYTVNDNDGNTSNEATVTIIIYPIADLPVANDDSGSGEKNNSLEIDVVANDTDSDGTVDPTTVNITLQPINGNASIDPATGIITYTPDNSFIGNDVIKYTVNDNDGNTSNEAIVNITIEGNGGGNGGGE